MQLMDLIGLEFGMTHLISPHTKHLSVPYNPNFLLNTLQPLYPVWSTFSVSIHSIANQANINRSIVHVNKMEYKYICCQDYARYQAIVRFSSSPEILFLNFII